MARIVLVHGSVGNGDSAWLEQRPLAEEYELVILNRPGFPPGPLVDRVDFEEHAEWVVARMRPGDHLCGHSYGGVVSLYAASQAPELRSLTVVEPPAFGIASDRPEAAEFIARLKPLWSDTARASVTARVTGQRAGPVFRNDPRVNLRRGSRRVRARGTRGRVRRRCGQPRTRPRSTSRGS
jgi:pimeloyl-ACP methyl ester carboxylesterase